MRNIISKTLFISILGSFLLSPVARADRQGGGTLRVAFNVVESNISHSVRYKTHENNILNFDYSWNSNGRVEMAEAALTKQELSKLDPAVVRALLESKLHMGWSEIDR